MWWFQQGLSILPSALVIWMSASLIFSYISAVLLHHVDTLGPYVSDTLSVPPESCIFGMMINISALLGIATIYVQYKQVLYLNPEESIVLKLNKAGVVLGMVCCFGLCIAANFQKSNMIAVHSTGACLVFVTGIFYILLQTILSYKLPPRNKVVFRVRLLILLWGIASIVSMFISSVMLYSVRCGMDFVQKMHWDPNDKGYRLHITSTISEWSFAFSFVSFFLTYIRDFQKINLYVVVQLDGYSVNYTNPQFAADEPRLPISGSL